MLGLKVRTDCRRSGDWSHSAAVQCDLIRRSREKHRHEVPEPESGGAAWDPAHIPAKAQVSAEMSERDVYIYYFVAVDFPQKIGLGTVSKALAGKSVEERDTL